MCRGREIIGGQTWEGVMKISRKIKDKVAVLKDGELVSLLMCVSPAWRSLRYVVRAELARRKVWASRWGIKR